jgi:hypothetical protein
MRKSESVLQWLCGQPPAISGLGGHNQIFKVACQLWRKSLAPTEVFHYLDIYNQRCRPPWTFSELKHKLNDSYVAVHGGAGEEGRAYNKLDYETTQWMELRKEVISRAGGICEMCRKAKAETGHHLTYRFGVLCPPKFLMAVCWPCHEQIHGQFRVPSSRKKAERLFND